MTLFNPGTGVRGVPVPYLSRHATLATGTLPGMEYDPARRVNVLPDGTSAALHAVLGRTSTMTKMRENSDVDP